MINHKIVSFDMSHSDIQQRFLDLFQNDPPGYFTEYEANLLYDAYIHASINNSDDMMMVIDAVLSERIDHNARRLLLLQLISLLPEINPGAFANVGQIVEFMNDILNERGGKVRVARMAVIRCALTHNIYNAKTVTEIIRIHSSKIPSRATPQYKEQETLALLYHGAIPYIKRHYGTG